MIGRKTTTLGIMALPAMAQNLSFGANNFYTSNIVTPEPVTFDNYYGLKLAANLFRPHINNTANVPAIIVSPPYGATKEQSANLYATKLAEQGFATLSIDLSHWGSSEGEPRNAVLPDMQTESFSAAVDYLSNHTFVDRDRIGVLGICGSAGLAISAAKIDPRLKAIATVSMYDMGSLQRTGLNNSQTVSQRKEALIALSAQRQSEVDGGEVGYSAGTPNEVTPESDPVDLEFYDFYRTSRAQFTPEGASQNTTSHRTTASLPAFLNFYPFSDIDTISPRPLLFVSGDWAHSRDFSEDAHARAAGPKELYWVTGAGHVDLYDRVDLIPFQKLAQFFRSNLV